MLLVVLNYLQCSDIGGEHPTTQFFSGRMPFLLPNQQCQSTEGNFHNINNTEKIWHTKTTLWVKKDTKLLPITSPNTNRFSNFFSLTDSVVNLQQNRLNIPPRLKHVASLPCEIWMSEKWCRSETCIVIKESQGSIAKHLRNDELLHYTFINQSAGERIF